MLGAGPAGSAAALAALAEGAAVSIAEKSRTPRHKVCGEFLSPGAPEVLEALGVWREIMRLGPSPIRTFILRAGSVERRYTLPEYGFGISRFHFDRVLYEQALRRGATAMTERVPGAATVIATGRRAVQPRGSRLFGFKAHFSGPARDAVELFFFPGWYVGVSPIEGGLTNVCGLAPEGLLAAKRFAFDDLVGDAAPLAERLRPLCRTMSWMTVGPVVFAPARGVASDPYGYPAGDALSFVDPFTGTGILNALLTGGMAGAAAARGTTPAAYLARCRRSLDGPFRVAGLVRAALACGWGPVLARLLPPALLFRLTRPAGRAHYSSAASCW